MGDRILIFCDPRGIKRVDDSRFIFLLVFKDSGLPMPPEHTLVNVFNLALWLQMLYKLARTPWEQVKVEEMADIYDIKLGHPPPLPQ
jgi:hypothetical protein